MQLFTLSAFAFALCTCGIFSFQQLTVVDYIIADVLLKKRKKYQIQP